jgi:adenylyltransferase/sulfurtransferase
MGGLGCPAAQYLAAGGVSHIGIVDHDIVQVSNLHRQTLYGEADVGLTKVGVAEHRLLHLNLEATSKRCQRNSPRDCAHCAALDPAARLQ